MTAPEPADVVVVDLGDAPIVGPSGVLWGLDGEQLNANLVKLAAGESMPEHVNDTLDVLIVMQAGAGTVLVNGVEHSVASDTLMLIPRGSRRSITADRQMLYFSIHMSHGGLDLQARP